MMNLEYVKNKVAEMSRTGDEAMMDELAFCWLEDMAKDYGDNGQIARDLLLVVRRLLD